VYTKMVPFKDLNGKPRNIQVNFNLFEREVFKLLAEFQAIFKWQESIKDAEMRDLPTEEVVGFYNNFEEILLSAYGEPSEDGLYFHKGGRRFEFEESAVFNACMVSYVTDPTTTQELLDGLMPKDMQEMVKKADANMAALAASDTSDAVVQAEIEKLRAQLAEAQAQTDGNKSANESTS
jgi:ribosomal protein L12E/L44/L45/RPP1/RPP2